MNANVCATEDADLSREYTSSYGSPQCWEREELKGSR